MTLLPSTIKPVYLYDFCLRAETNDLKYAVEYKDKVVNQGGIVDFGRQVV